MAGGVTEQSDGSLPQRPCPFHAQPMLCTTRWMQVASRLSLFYSSFYSCLLGVAYCTPDDRGALRETGELQNDARTHSSLPYPAWKLSSMCSTWWSVFHGLAKPAARNWPGEALRAC